MKTLAPAQRRTDKRDVTIIKKWPLYYDYKNSYLCSIHRSVAFSNIQPKYEFASQLPPCCETLPLRAFYLQYFNNRNLYNYCVPLNISGDITGVLVTNAFSANAPIVTLRAAYIALSAQLNSSLDISTIRSNAARAFLAYTLLLH
jgi:hypothetical protein